MASVVRAAQAAHLHPFHGLRRHAPRLLRRASICPTSRTSLRCSRSRVSAVLDDFEFPPQGPVEPCRPKFHRESFVSTGPVVVDPGSSSQDRKPRRRGRKYKPATPSEALTGALISAVCAGALWNWVREAAAYVEDNPPAHNLPNNLTDSVNSCVVSMVWGTGGLAVSMFGVAAIGLSLLAVQTASKATQPKKQPNL